MIIRTTCPACGTLGLAAAQVRLEEPRRPDAPPGLQTSCVFDCPRCGQHVRLPVDESTRDALLRAGVRVEWPSSSPRGGGHPERPPGGLPFTFDDLLDLHLLLETDDWFDGFTVMR